MCPDVQSQKPSSGKISVFVRCKKGERMQSACIVPTMMHGGGGAMVWGYSAGDTVGEFIQTWRNQHPAVTCHPSWFAFSWTVICFSDDLASTVTWPEPNRDGLEWERPQIEGKRANECSESLGDYLIKLTARKRSVQSCNQSKGWLFWWI